MNLKFSTELNSIEGEPINEVFADQHGIQQVIEKGKPKRLTAWTVARTCLMSDIKADGPRAAQRDRDDAVDGSEKFKRMELALRIFEAQRGGEDCAVTAEECVLLKQLAGKIYTSNAMYAFYRFIDGKEQCQAPASGGDNVVAIGAKT